MSPIIGIEGADEVVPLICKMCCEDVFEEGEQVHISKAYAAIHAKSGRLRAACPIIANRRLVP